MPTNGKTPILDMKYNVDYDVEILDSRKVKTTMALGISIK